MTELPAELNGERAFLGFISLTFSTVNAGLSNFATAPGPDGGRRENLTKIAIGRSPAP